MAGERDGSSQKKANEERKGRAVETVNVVDRFKVIINRHQKRQMRRNEIVLGRAEPDLRVQSKHKDSGN